MSSEPDNSARPTSSIFISYASADREAVRLLADTLTRAGLDVWLDQEELAGGDAWDAKIRQQIRTCTYFMPVISATTEARREGYFRREWRFAVERTLDLADDVLFLTPVVIDQTPDQGARVPEKFTSVQWLRCPGGRETPQLVGLARRLAAGEVVASAPPSAPPPLARGALSRREARAARRSRGPLPPFQPFPAFPAAGHRARFAYDFVLWLGHTLVALWARLPRWLRYVAMIYIVIKGLTLVFSDHDKKPSSAETAAEKAAIANKIAQAFTPKGDQGTGDDLTAQKIIQATSAVMDTLEAGRPLAIVNFSTTDAGASRPAHDAFEALYDELKKAGHERDVSVGAIPLPAGADEATILARAATLKCRWLLVGTAKTAFMDDFSVQVSLYDAKTRKVIWWASETGDTDAGASVGATLARKLLKQVPFDSAAPAPPSPPPAAPPKRDEGRSPAGPG